LRSPRFINVEAEAACVCALICGREEGKALKLGDLSDAFLEYSQHLSAGHPSLAMLLERFDDVVIDAEEDALKRMENVSLPSEAEARLRETMLRWRSPEEKPSPAGGQGTPLFQHARDVIDKLRLAHEQVLIDRLPIVNSQEAYGAMMAEVEREFVGARTILRGQVRGGRNRHRALLETEMQTMYGWPPVGPGPSLKRAARQYIAELGAEHPVVEDFVAAARRHIKLKENKCVEDMAPLEKEILELRGLVDAVPPAPKLMRDSYREKMNEKCLEAMQRLESLWKPDLGTDSAVYLRFLRSTLGKEAFLDHCEEQAANIAYDMRRLGPRAAPSLEENHVSEARAVSSTSLAHYMRALDTDGRKAAAMNHDREFATELKRVEGGVSLFHDPGEEDDGWHRPPGFKKVESPPMAPAPPPPPPPPEIRLDRELPGMRDAESLSMRLHGVCFEDVNRHNELLLLEMCADVIAEECGIPRDCIFNMKFSEPRKAEEPAPEAEAPVLSDADLGAASGPEGSVPGLSPLLSEHCVRSSAVQPQSVAA
jgi:hypothetical protein